MVQLLHVKIRLNSPSQYVAMLRMLRKTVSSQAVWDKIPTIAKIFEVLKAPLLSFFPWVGISWPLPVTVEKVLELLLHPLHILVLDDPQLGDLLLELPLLLIEVVDHVLEWYNRSIIQISMLPFGSGQHLQVVDSASPSCCTHFKIHLLNQRQKHLFYKNTDTGKNCKLSLQLTSLTHTFFNSDKSSDDAPL